MDTKNHKDMMCIFGSGH